MGIQYEVFWQNLPSSEWIERTKLIKLGFEKKLIECDEKTAAAAGLVNRPLTTAGVRKHLEDLGLEAEYAEHTKCVVSLADRRSRSSLLQPCGTTPTSLCSMSPQTTLIATHLLHWHTPSRSSAVVSL